MKDLQQPIYIKFIDTDYYLNRQKGVHHLDVLVEHSDKTRVFSYFRYDYKKIEEIYQIIFDFSNPQTCIADKKYITSIKYSEKLVDDEYYILTVFVNYNYTSIPDVFNYKAYKKKHLNNLKKVIMDITQIEMEEIKAKYINANNIIATSIDANDIDFYAYCIAYNSLKCKNISGTRTNNFYKCLDNEIEFKK